MSTLAHCVHYSGIDYVRGDASTTCAAGVRYRAVRLAPPLRAPGELPTVLPCQGTARTHGAAADTCPARRWPTPEEQAAELADLERAADELLAGRCPRCGATLERAERAGGGYTARCPACPKVGVIGCARR